MSCVTEIVEALRPVAKSRCVKDSTVYIGMLPVCGTFRVLMLKGSAGIVSIIS